MHVIYIFTESINIHKLTIWETHITDMHGFTYAAGRAYTITLRRLNNVIHLLSLQKQLRLAYKVHHYLKHV